MYGVVVAWESVEQALHPLSWLWIDVVLFLDHDQRV